MEWGEGVICFCLDSFLWVVINWFVCCVFCLKMFKMLLWWTLSKSRCKTKQSCLNLSNVRPRSEPALELYSRTVSSVGVMYRSSGTNTGSYSRGGNYKKGPFVNGSLGPMKFDNKFCLNQIWTLKFIEYLDAAEWHECLSTVSFLSNLNIGYSQTQLSFSYETIDKLRFLLWIRRMDHLW